MSLPQRKSIRLKTYNYKQDGFYFITICVQNKESLLGKITENEHIVYDAGLMIEKTWNDLAKYYKGVVAHEFVIMPNHIHGIIELQSSTIDIPTVIQRFKSFTTKQYIDGVNNLNWQPFCKKLWQRNYYEHVVRNEESLEVLRNYIIDNPLKWEEDVLYL